MYNERKNIVSQSTEISPCIPLESTSGTLISSWYNTNQKSNQINFICTTINIVSAKSHTFTCTKNILLSHITNICSQRDGHILSKKSNATPLYGYTVQNISYVSRNWNIPLITGLFFVLFLKSICHIFDVGHPQLCLWRISACCTAKQNWPTQSSIDWCHSLVAACPNT